MNWIGLRGIQNESYAPQAHRARLGQYQLNPELFRRQMAIGGGIGPEEIQKTKPAHLDTFQARGLHTTAPL